MSNYKYYLTNLTRRYWEKAIFALLEDKERKMGRVLTCEEYDQFIRQNGDKIEEISMEMLADAGQEY